MLGFHSQDKDSERRAQKKQARLIFYAEAHPILSKDRKSRAQRQVCSIFSAKPQPITPKDSENQAQEQTGDRNFPNLTTANRFLP